MAQCFVAMSEQGKQSQTGKQQLSLRVNMLCAISGQSRRGLVVFGEQYLSGKNKLLRLEPKMTQILSLQTDHELGAMWKEDWLGTRSGLHPGFLPDYPPAVHLVSSEYL